MTFPEVLKFLHVMSVIVWVGGGVMLQILLYRANRLGVETVSVFGQAAEWTSNRVFMPASFTALGTGIWLVLATSYSFADLWITLGFVGFALSALIGMAILGPTSKKMAKASEERGPHDPVVRHLARRIDLAGRVDLVILVAVVGDMIVKPGL